MNDTSADETLDELAAAEAPAADDTEAELRAQCTSFLMNHGVRSPVQALDEMISLGEELGADTYGAGGAVTELEKRVRQLLGKPAVVFRPSGTMAQQIALRIHADRSGRKVVAFHPTCPLELHEDKAYQRLHGLVGRPVGDATELMTAEALASV